jgi:hypothetical protein
MSMKKMFSILVLVLLLGMSTQLCFATEEEKFDGSIELIGYFERINGQEWNLDLNYKLTDKVKIGVNENIHQYQQWQNKKNEYNTEFYLNWQCLDQLNFYFVPFNTIDSPYFKIKYEF